MDDGAVSSERIAEALGAFGEAAQAQGEMDGRSGGGGFLVSALRAESAGLKDEFAKYCFQAVSICSIASGAIFNFMYTNPFVGVAAVVILPIILTTSRLGTNFYASVNRHAGYELHLARVRNIPPDYVGGWHEKYKEVQWEEAMRAWRIVQTTLFETIHHREGLVTPWRYRWGFEPSPTNPVWYAQKSQFGEHSRVTWYPGTYLKVMQSLLYVIATIEVFILVATPVAIWIKYTEIPKSNLLHPSAIITAAMQGSLFSLPRHDLIGLFGIVSTAAVAVLAIGLTVVRLWKDVVRRHVLEDGMLSIHSCAIVWQAVIVAHYRAVDRCRKYGMASHKLADLANRASGADRKNIRSGAAEAVIDAMSGRANGAGSADGAGLMGYTFWLGQEARSMAAHAKRLQAWIGSRPPS